MGTSQGTECQITFKCHFFVGFLKFGEQCKWELGIPVTWSVVLIQCFGFLQHPEIKADRSFVLYRPPPVVRDPALVEEFLERAKFIADDLNWLLALPHDRFWCQVKIVLWTLKKKPEQSTCL